MEFAECLASCGTGPVCLIGDDFHESVKASDVEKLIKNYD
ncbi:MAG: NAD(P)H-dependent oxidoreductase subunit E [Verrucomicrobiota bacterium]|nr:NAD(P)H-dependent oxidoreductase subunit E [Verrucomicrobiota bacterium]